MAFARDCRALVYGNSGETRERPRRGGYKHLLSSAATTTTRSRVIPRARVLFPRCRATFRVTLVIKRRTITLPASRVLMTCSYARYITRRPLSHPKCHLARARGFLVNGNIVCGIYLPSRRFFGQWRFFCATTHTTHTSHGTYTHTHTHARAEQPCASFPSQRSFDR